MKQDEVDSKRPSCRRFQRTLWSCRTKRHAYIEALKSGVFRSWPEKGGSLAPDRRSEVSPSPLLLVLRARRPAYPNTLYLGDLDAPPSPLSLDRTLLLLPGRRRRITPARRADWSDRSCPPPGKRSAGYRRPLTSLDVIPVVTACTEPIAACRIVECRHQANRDNHPTARRVTCRSIKTWPARFKAANC